MITKCGCNNLKKLTNKCAGCGELFCLKHLFIRVDGNNGAITKNSKEYCEDCYKKVYK